MNTLGRRRPWWATEEEAEQMDEWERALRQRFGWPRGWGQRQQAQEWTPAIDLYNKGDMLLLRAELPGVSQDRIDITLHQGILTIRGERKPDKDVEGDEQLCCERSVGSFYRAIQLPAEVDSDKIAAEYKDGVLTITLPKQPKAQPQKAPRSSSDDPSG